MQRDASVERHAASVERRSDEALIASAQLGDHSALGSLVERHHAPLLGYLYRMLDGDRALAEDLVQDTFVRLITQRSYRAGKPVKPWLYAIATNLARDRHRSAARFAASAEIDAAEHVPDLSAGPEERSLASAEAQVVRGALRCLGDEQRAAIVLRFYQELSLKEIAMVLDIPIGTVKSRLSIASRRLRELLVSAREGTPR